MLQFALGFGVQIPVRGSKAKTTLIAKPTPDFPFCPFLVLYTFFVRFWGGQKCIPLLFPRFQPSCETDWICSAWLACFSSLSDEKDPLSTGREAIGVVLSLIHGSVGQFVLLLLTCL